MTGKRKTGSEREHSMSEDGVHPWESILRLCEAAAPEAWYPHLFAKQEGVEPEELDSCLEEMSLSGLIEREDSDAERGPAITLTREGQRVLLDPEALQRLRSGQPITYYDRAGFVRQALLGRSRPYITYLVLAVNVLVFLAGYYAARKIGAGPTFLDGTPLTVPFAQVLEKSGALSPEHVIERQWRRFLTAGFVHVGWLNLVLNLIPLFLAGRFVERVWGHVHYLLIYLCSTIGGNCLGIAHSPDAPLLAGATNSICGLLAAELVWFLFNRRYLPRPVMRQARRLFLMNIVLLVFITTYRNVSPWGDLGGAGAGAVTALLLQLHRFGPPMWRWLALIGFMPLVWYGHYALERARATDANWQKVEEKQFMEQLARPAYETMKEARQIYEKQVEPVLQTHPTRRTPEQLEAVWPVLTEQIERLTTLVDQLASAGPYYDRDLAEARDAGEQYVVAGIELFQLTERVLRLGEKRTDKDRKALREQKEQVEELYKKWRSLL